MTQASKLLWGYLQVHLVPLGLQVASAALAEQHDRPTITSQVDKFRVSDRDHALTRTQLSAQLKSFSLALASHC